MSTLLCHHIRPTHRGISSTVSEASPERIKLTELYIINNLLNSALEGSTRQVVFSLGLAKSELGHAIRIQEGLAR